MRILQLFQQQNKLKKERITINMSCFRPSRRNAARPRLPQPGCLLRVHRIREVDEIMVASLKLMSLERTQDNNPTSARSEHAELTPKELSGDENDQGSMVSGLIPANKANFMLTVTIIVKSIIGAGIISLPYTMSKLGYVFTIAIFFLFGTLNQFCCSLLLRSKNLSGHSNYSTIMGYIWGNRLSKFLGSLVIFLDNFGTCVLELIILKTSIKKILSDLIQDQSILDEFYCSELFLVILLALLELPLILLKKIEKLRFFSFLGVAGILAFIFGIISHYIIRRSEGFQGEPMSAFPRDWYQAFSVMPNIIFAFDYQMNFFPIYKGLRNATDRKMNLASTVGLASCGMSYLVIGVLGYSLAGDKAEANFLESIPYQGTNPALFIIINVCFLVSIACAYALMFFGCRNNFIAIANLIEKSWKKRQLLPSSQGIISQQMIQSEQSSYRSNKTRKNIQYYIYTIIIHLTISIIALFLNNIQDILNLIGAICENLIAIILPCTFYFMLVRKQNKQKGCVYYLTMGIACIVAPYGIFTIVANYI